LSQFTNLLVYLISISVKLSPDFFGSGEQ